jgi:hypothetical protein
MGMPLFIAARATQWLLTCERLPLGDIYLETTIHVAVDGIIDGASAALFLAKKSGLADREQGEGGIAG